MKVIQDDAGAEIILAAAGYRTDPPFKGFVVIGDDGRPRGAVALTRRSLADVEVSAVGEAMASIRLVRALFRYIFETIGARRASAQTGATNERSARALRCLRFIEEGRKRAYGANGEDAVFWGQLREECPFLRG